tara:strand:- start:1111 stop:2367 length:1257 start_codon:yes stop_codon:yes gene_type:complete
MSTAVSAQNLTDIYHQVLQSDPRLLVESLRVEVGIAQEEQAFGALLPQVSITSSWTQNEQLDGNSNKESFSGERHSLSVNQPLFDMPKYYAWKSRDVTHEQLFLEQQEVQSRIRLDTIERYFGLLDSIDFLLLAREERTLTKKKVERIKALYKMQRAKITELYEVEARLDKLVSLEIDAMQARDLAKEELNELTNLSVGDVSQLSETSEYVQRVENINKWSEQAVPRNYGLMALSKAIEAAQTNVNKQSAEHLPQLNLQLSKQKSNIGYEYAASPSTTTEVAGLNFTLPLFSGGSTKARVQEAIKLLEISEAKYELEKRKVIKQSRNKFLKVNALARRVQAAIISVESAKKNYQAMNKSFELGISTVAQVLDAQSNFSASKRDYKKAKYMYIMNKAELLQISGELNDDVIYEINKWLL